jgi:hypothetical protein
VFEGDVVDLEPWGERAFSCEERVIALVNCGNISMRCYFLRAGRIEAVEELPGLSDDEAVAKAHALFSERKREFEGFEVWNRARVIIRHPEHAVSNNVAVWPLHRVSPRAVPSVRPAESSHSIPTPLKPPLKA